VVTQSRWSAVTSSGNAGWKATWRGGSWPRGHSTLATKSTACTALDMDRCRASMVIAPDVVGERAPDAAALSPLRSGKSPATYFEPRFSKMRSSGAAAEMEEEDSDTKGRAAGARSNELEAGIVVTPCKPRPPQG
jgi:hypothetical protein